MWHYSWLLLNISIPLPIELMVGCLNRIQRTQWWGIGRNYSWQCHRRAHRVVHPCCKSSLRQRERERVCLLPKTTWRGRGKAKAGTYGEELRSEVRDLQKSSQKPAKRRKFVLGEGVKVHFWFKIALWAVRCVHAHVLLSVAHCASLVLFQRGFWAKQVFFISRGLLRTFGEGP